MTPQIDDLLTHWARDLPENFFETAPFLMHSIDAEGRLLLVSRLWAERLGYKPDEMVGKCSADFMTPQSRARALDVVRPRFFREGSILDVEYDFMAKDGTVVPVLLSSAAIYAADGTFQRSLSVIADNSVARRTQEALREIAQEAEAASQAKSRFLAAMSHEIRTPMNAIMGFAQLLHRSDLDPVRNTQVEAILSSSKSLMSLLTDLLDLSEAEAGHMRVSRRPIELAEMIETLTEWWHTEARNKGLRLDVQLEPGLAGCVLSDQTRLEQVLNNLLGNAVKFTDSGGVTLRVGEDGWTQDGVRLRFEVSDTGPGMSEAEASKLFRPFTQLDTGKARGRKGWGLGLSICRQIAEAMEAELSVETAPGGGARFTFVVPVGLPGDNGSTDDATRPDAPPLPEALKSRRLQLLLVEDTPLNAQMLTTILSGAGQSVTHAETGEAALGLLQRHPFDLVLMDIMLPGIDGVETTRRLRALGFDLPVLACSAINTAEARAQWREAGIDGVVGKPVDHAQLFAVIAGSLDRNPQDE